ncbi:hypothetical protein IU500_06700 [Nocardia terpenica]|uniref:hypothetical protein n=1 Tax=Nocardia terpenica TaxID=455432 RepID=UPI001894BB67|nr:hypothetical protein [Nocardia terpenica]MBF6060467.1 hypothetical protein [Nocardia terpenica]MBF6103727.1 hypothetical protein [Nocardia terpenica]MBF6111899.1 hypothetical protein [Nocardia terpenica]MBF6117948.1 hypothetical protein [Nocardia terpenica]MBF6155326.1 hypothetical protein [Nocardia terpenica]
MDPFGDYELVWPAQDHDLNAAPQENWSFSDLGWQRQRFGMRGRIMGYRRAAELLYEAMVTSHSIRDLDTVVFPHVACWRHFVELQLKVLVGKLRALSALPAEARKHHKIDQLWNEVRNLILEHHPGERDDLENVTRVILQLAQMDPDGQEFRYATRTDGTPALPATDRINLTAFHNAMVGVANYLDAADTGYGELLDTKLEMDAYNASEFDNQAE